MVVSIAWYYGYLWMFDLLFGLRYLEGGVFIENRPWILLSIFLEYAITFSVIHAIDSLRQLRDKEKQAAELKERSTPASRR